MGSSSSKEVDHGNYVSTPVPVPTGPAARVIIIDGSRSQEEYSFVVGESEKLEETFVVLPGVSARIPVTVDLVGPGAEADLKGIYISEGSDEVTFDITMHHRVEGCTSHQLFNGLASGQSKCAFFGKIIVAPDAQKTEAYQENHNRSTRSPAWRSMPMMSSAPMALPSENSTRTNSSICVPAESRRTRPRSCR